ncbi:MAG: hypothetical protein ABIR79_21365, partial [Candidatus Binatia bacterium]
TVFDRLTRLAPALVSRAALELGDDVFTSVVLAAPARDPVMLQRVLAHVLVMMRGNRASSLITYFTDDGRLHHVPMHGGQPAPSAATEHALDRVRGVVRRALAVTG